MSAKMAVTCIDHTPPLKAYAGWRHRASSATAGAVCGAMALMIEDSLSRAEMSRCVDIDVQTLHYWVVRYNRGGIDGLRDAARSGRPPKLDEG